MADFEAKNIRNVILLSHSHAGKTLTAEHLLSTAGAIPKPGSVDDGSTISDYNDDEKERKTSINSSGQLLAYSTLFTIFLLFIVILH